MPPSAIVSFHRAGSTPGRAASVVTVPAEIAKLIPDDVTAFRVRLTDEGILYEPIRELTDDREDLPAWVKN